MVWEQKQAGIQAGIQAEVIYRFRLGKGARQGSKQRVNLNKVQVGSSQQQQASRVSDRSGNADKWFVAQKVVCCLVLVYKGLWSFLCKDTGDDSASALITFI